MQLLFALFLFAAGFGLGIVGNLPRFHSRTFGKENRRFKLFCLLTTLCITPLTIFGGLFALVAVALTGFLLGFYGRKIGLDNAQSLRNGSDDAVVFAITVVEEPPGRHSPDSRAVGWYPSLERAIAAVLANEGGIDECRFTYAVVEELATGVYPTVKRQFWFKFAEGSWKQLDEDVYPYFSEGVTNWSLG